VYGDGGRRGMRRERVDRIGVPLAGEPVVKRAEGREGTT
jgi:hypothetical protein